MVAYRKTNVDGAEKGLELIFLEFGFLITTNSMAKKPKFAVAKSGANYVPITL